MYTYSSTGGETDAGLGPSPRHKALFDAVKKGQLDQV